MRRVKEAEEKEGVQAEEEGEVVADLWTEDSTAPYGVIQLSPAGAFRKKGGNIALMDLDELCAHCLKGGMDRRTVKVQLGNSTCMDVVTLKGFQRLTRHFIIVIIIIIIIILSSFIIVFMSVLVCKPLLSMLKCFWLNQWKSCVSMVHIGDGLGAVWDMKHLFLPHSRLSGVDTKGTAALGHWRTVRCGAQGGD